jgi:large subunit ribosomal protein L24
MANKATRNKSKIRKGDKVVVIAGNDRGQTGIVLHSMDNDRVLVQGVNMRKKHVKPTQENPKGDIIDIEKSIHISNVQVCDDDDKPVKLKVKHDSNGEKTYFYKKNDQEIVYRSVKKHASAK